MDVYGCTPAKKPKTSHTTMYVGYPFIALEEAVKDGIMVQRNDVYDCTVCKTFMTGSVPANSHLQGKGHKRAVQAFRMQAAAGQNTPRDITDLSSTDVHAAIRSQQVLSEKMTSEAHLKNLRQEPLAPRLSPYKDVQDTVVTSSLLPSARQPSQHGHSDLADAIKSGLVISESVGMQALLTCTLCNKTCNGGVPMSQHLASDIHARQKEKEELRLRLASSRGAPPAAPTLITNTSMQYDSVLPASAFSEQGNELDEAKEKGIIVPADYDKSHLRCTVCNINCTGPDAVQAHLKGRSHRKEELRLRYTGRDASPAAPTLTPMQYDSALPAGASSQQDVVDAIQSGQVISTSVGTQVLLACTLCNKTCSGDIPMSQHLASDVHAKQKEKEELRLRFSSSRDVLPAAPTLTTNTSVQCDSALPAVASCEQGNELAEAKEKGIIVPADYDNNHLRCTVCDINCTGPDAVREHLKGRSHKRKLLLSPQLPVTRAARETETQPLSPASSASARSDVVDYIPPPLQFLDPPEVQGTASQKMKHGERGGNLEGAAKSSTSIFDEIPHGDLIRDMKIYGPNDSLDDLFD